MPPEATLSAALSKYAHEATRKLLAIGVRGGQEDQIRSPLENLIADIADLVGVGRDNVVTVGESSLAELKTRPDFAVQCFGALVGFIEVKAPGHGADPRKFRDSHNKEQWEKLRALPNLIYSDGNEFSLWRDGELLGRIVRLDGDITTDGGMVTSAPGLEALFASFLQWEPIPPRTPRQLAELTARICRLMRDEVAEQLARGNPALTDLAAEWRKLLFPDADDRAFADGYAQAVTFGLLVARARGISVGRDVSHAAHEIGQTHSLIGGALFVLTQNTETHAALKTSIGTLVRVLEVVDWQRISKGNPDAWLYFYEDFLSVYDAQLRRKTGSYYTPPEVVTAMVQFVDTVLRTRFHRRAGLAAPDVTVVDPAVGTGTYLLAALRLMADTIEADQGPGGVPGMIEDALKRLIGFEIQLGPFAVAQLRLLAELADLGVSTGHSLRMYVTDTLGNPYVEAETLGLLYEPIAESRRQANEIKKNQPVLVVLGNPPYKERARGLGGWIEEGNPDANVAAPLADWFAPKSWGVGAHLKHLRNLYIYFWRWATWKVFDHHPTRDSGIVCFITVAGFLNGPGFQMMRDYLRRTCDEIWVIDCSPDGHQPEVNTRVFQGVQQPVCILVASRSGAADPEAPARVKFRSLPAGHRQLKFEALGVISLDDGGWLNCPDGWREPFLPSAEGAWATYPALQDLFVYDGSGVMPGRTWVIAPDRETLTDRWDGLKAAAPALKEVLFHPHQGGDRTVTKVTQKGLPGHAHRPVSVADDHDMVVPPVRYAVRSLDRQWIIPDNRLINRPNPGLWAAMSPAQVFLTASHDRTPSGGPAMTVSAVMPDLHHYHGRGGRVFPLWLDHSATVSNVRPGVIKYIGDSMGVGVSGEDIAAYVVGILAHPGFVERFGADLVTPGLKVPISAVAETFGRVAELGRRVIWLHTFGERCTDRSAERSAGSPRLPIDRAPRISADGQIPSSPSEMPDTISYDPARHRLNVGAGHIDNVTPQMWAYEVSGMHVVSQWFSYRRLNRSRPLIGDRRSPSDLERIRPDRWLSEYTSELLDLLHIVGLLVDLEPAQTEALDRVCDGPTIPFSELAESGAFVLPEDYPEQPFRLAGSEAAAPRLFD